MVVAVKVTSTEDMSKALKEKDEKYTGTLDPGMFKNNNLSALIAKQSMIGRTQTVRVCTCSRC